MMRRWPPFFAIVILVISPVLSEAASRHADIERLIAHGQWSQALHQTEQLLRTDAQDAELRFLYARLLQETGQAAQARQIYQSLMAEFPARPESYNNLAVVYAGQGDYQQAQKLLQQAIHAHAGFAEVYENLTAVYGHMAGLAYRQALEEGDSTPADNVRLRLIDTVDWPGKAVSLKSHGPAMADNIDIPERDDKIVIKAVQDWARAWASQDVEAYLSMYDEQFVPPQGLSLAEWQKQRRVRLREPDFIRVQVRRPRLVWLADDVASVRFRQAYESNSLHDTVTKQLVLKWRKSQWRIIQENLLY